MYRAENRWRDGVYRRLSREVLELLYLVAQTRSDMVFPIVVGNVADVWRVMANSRVECQLQG